MIVILILILVFIGSYGDAYLESMGYDTSISVKLGWLACWFAVLEFLVMTGLSPPSYKLRKARSMMDKLEFKALAQSNPRGEETGAASLVASGNINSSISGNMDTEGGHVRRTATTGSELQLLNTNALNPIGPVDMYVPPAVTQQNKQAMNYGIDARSNTGATKLTMKPLPV